MADARLPDVPLSPERVENPAYNYGIGIDTHKRFIQVCILWAANGETLRIEQEFQTDWNSLKDALKYIETNIYGPGLEEPTIPIRYTIESTGCYHLPVVLAIKHAPSIINPVLAGPTRRKTDVLDARTLAQQSMLGLWKQSYVLSTQAETLRCLLAMRNEATRNASRVLNRLNNHALRYGHTLGRDGSMSHMKQRAIIEDMCRGTVPLVDCVNPEGLPQDVRCIFTDSFEFYDYWRKVAERYHNLTLKFAKSNLWPTGKGPKDGKHVLDCLMSCPSVGEVTALTWLSVIHDPRRFGSGNEVAAYCGSDPSVKVSAGKTTSHTKRKGNARLHHALKNCAAQLVRNHTDALGQWGYSILRRHRKAAWGRAINAVSRRLSVMLWHVHREAALFSYEQYRFMLAPEVPDVPLEHMNIHQRYKAMLAEKGFTSSGELARAFLSTLPQQKGIGPQCLNAVKEWIEANKLAPKTPSAQSLSNRLRPSNPDPGSPDSGLDSTKLKVESWLKASSSDATAVGSSAPTKPRLKKSPTASKPKARTS